MIAPTRLRGLSDAVRILEDHLHLAAQRPQRAPVEPRDVAARRRRRVPAVSSYSRTRQRPSVDLPQPDSPTRPSVSPRVHLEGRRRRRPARAATSRCSTPLPLTGKCFVDARAPRAAAAPLTPRAPAVARRVAAARSFSRRAGSRRSRCPGAARCLERGPLVAAGLEARAGSAARTRSPAAARAATAAGRGSSCSRRGLGRSRRGIEPSSPHVYGCCGLREQLALRAVLDDPARVHHARRGRRCRRRRPCRA